MKLFDTWVETALVTSKRFTQMVTSLRNLAQEVDRLTKTVQALALYVRQHQLILHDLDQVHQMMAQDMKEGSVDMSLPQQKQAEAGKKPN